MMTKACNSCGRALEDDASFCSGCGKPFQQEEPEPASEPTSASASASTAIPSSIPPEQQDWIKFLGPGAEYYLAQFGSFQHDGNDQFSLTWNWYPFLFGWLWFLYRKMYLYAAAFAVGPFLTIALLRGGMEILLMWGLAAGALSNYLYYGHVKRSLEELHAQPRVTDNMWDQTLADVGGVQPYVWWLGAGILVMAVALGIMNPPPNEPPPNQPAHLEDI